MSQSYTLAQEEASTHLNRKHLTSHARELSTSSRTVLNLTERSACLKQQALSDLPTPPFRSRPIRDGSIQ